jgi:hypothetical protein
VTNSFRNRNKRHGNVTNTKFSALYIYFSTPASPLFVYFGHYFLSLTMPSKDPVKRNEAAQRRRDKQIAVKKAAEDKEKEHREYCRINKQKSREKLAAQAPTMDPPAAENRQLPPTGSSSANGFASSMNIGRPHPELGAFTGTTLAPSSTFIRRQQQESTPRPFPPGSARKQTPRQQHLLTARRSQLNAHVQRTVAAQEREATDRFRIL